MIVALALGLVAVLPTYGPLPAASPTAPPGMRIPLAPGEALIVSSGSTNTAGYRLRVDTSGRTSLQQGDIAVRKTVSIRLVERFFADLRAAGPLDAMRPAYCMKSASFGTTMTIVYRGKTSPDVSCASAGRRLDEDALALADAAGFTITARPLPGGP